ncbi:MAG: hypothetical protein RI897_4169 [Verrucomicrobiota bacterium]
MVARAREGEGDAWDGLFRRYQLPLYSYVFELVHDEQVALDVVQETFISGVRYVGQLRDDRRFGSWLFGIARQKCLQHWRKRPGRWESLEGCEQDEVLVGEVEASPDEWLVRREDEERFMLALRSLSPAHREVLLLHFLEGFSLQEIGEVVGVGVGTVKSRMHYAKQALRERLEER